MSRLGRLVVVSVVVALVFAAGYAVGNLRTFRWMGGVLRTEVNGALGMHVEALSRFRIGDTTGAVRLLESQIDAAVTTLIVEQPWPLRSERDSVSLRTAKLYRRLYPDATAAHGVLEAYGKISDEPLDLSSCSLALQELLRRAEAEDLEEGDGEVPEESEDAV